jgi:hypothetical protein
MEYSIKIGYVQVKSDEVGLDGLMSEATRSISAPARFMTMS